ncbi:hypothetical protein PV327_004374 [Microctonus hyperodae]|uniref:NADH dehydrogenase [ubiquinone] 1 alpha subcomplex subunit 7 n=1 Tax=Microctonus hyperodae TaxID=165561 RepID=A0AA39FCF6_MICHY|nr:hypothetical protein PV327_004374 [Microctonus hyperodae]
MSKIPHRDVGPLIQIFRKVVRGRKFVPHLRFADDLAARTQPPPNIPGGPYHKTTKIYYHTRDARRLVEPPLVITTNKQLTAGSAIAAPTMKPVTPNQAYDPQLIEAPEPKYPDEVGQSEGI